MWDVKIRRLDTAPVTESGFISTMWDVKVDEERAIIEETQFYLDYVGCKENKKKGPEGPLCYVLSRLCGM